MATTLFGTACAEGEGGGDTDADADTDKDDAGTGAVAAGRGAGGEVAVVDKLSVGSYASSSTAVAASDGDDGGFSRSRACGRHFDRSFAAAVLASSSVAHGRLALREREKKGADDRYRGALQFIQRSTNASRHSSRIGGRNRIR